MIKPVLKKWGELFLRPVKFYNNIENNSFQFNKLGWGKMWLIVCFVDIGWLVARHCLALFSYQPFFVVVINYK